MIATLDEVTWVSGKEHFRETARTGLWVWGVISTEYGSGRIPHPFHDQRMLCFLSF